ncbi:MAG: FAD-dependent monooxygenase [SAR86 cluster bacterium]|uniref:FAD-dependent monooxygenase n=1 Tax=SAR86 cluster bacterium TaxID=2030880 RepID=A0A937LKB3_9GAMM|nr:FAD-dependent monooxygenase [SAR86 cluster bacterium]
MTNQILIVGSGVNGLVLAKVLQQKDIPFLILEKNSQYIKNPERTVALTEDSIRFLNTLDKNLDINAWATPVNNMLLYQDTELNLSLNKDEEKISTICQLDKLHSQMLKGLEKKIIMGQEINAIDESEKSITLLTESNSYQGDIAFACDGINSSLRSLSEFTIDEWYYGQKAYIALVEAEHKNEAHQFFSQSGTLALLPLSLEKEYYSIIFCTNTTTDPLNELNTSIKNNAKHLNMNEVKSISGGHDLKHHSANRLYSGRVVLCGDAANSFHPMAGQGLNMGIGDVMHIADNIQEIISGNLRALDDYSSKRNTKNAQMTWIIQSLFGAFGNSAGFTKSILNEGMKFLDNFPKAKEKIIEFANKN